MLAAGADAVCLPSLTSRFTWNVPTVVNVFVTLSPVAVVLSLNLQLNVSGSLSGSLAPLERIVNAVTPAMPFPVGETEIVPGTGGSFFVNATTATAAAAPPPARPIHSHFFEPPPPPPVDDT